MIRHRSRFSLVTHRINVYCVMRHILSLICTLSLSLRPLLRYCYSCLPCPTLSLLQITDPDSLVVASLRSNKYTLAYPLLNLLCLSIIYHRNKVLFEVLHVVLLSVKLILQLFLRVLEFLYSSESLLLKDCLQPL